MSNMGQLLILAMAFMLAIQRASGGLLCENLPKDICAFSVSMDGKRCILEKYDHGTETKYSCKQSQVRAANLAEWIEADECVAECGANRNWTGISSEPLLDIQFLDKFCSPPCYRRCPNMVDLYFKLAEAEGVALPEMCIKSRREILENLDVSHASGSSPAPSSGNSSNTPTGNTAKGDAPSMQAPASLAASASAFLFYVLYIAKLI